MKSRDLTVREMKTETGYVLDYSVTDGRGNLKARVQLECSGVADGYHRSWWTVRIGDGSGFQRPRVYHDEGEAKAKVAEVLGKAGVE